MSLEINEEFEKNKDNNNNKIENKISNEEISSMNFDKSFEEKNQNEYTSKEDKQKIDKKEKLKNYISYDINSFHQLLINKLMPLGYKLENEDNLLKRDEKKPKNYLHRKHRRDNTIPIENKKDNEISNINFETKNLNDNKNIIKQKKPRKKLEGTPIGENNEFKIRRPTREHKPKIIEDLGYIDKDVIKGKSNPLFRAVNKICEKGIMKIKKIPYYSFFYNSSKPDEPSLIKIEKNIRDFKYQSTYEFIMDLRRLWSHFLKIYNDQLEIKERVYEMCRISEELYWELESIKIENVHLEEMNKKVDNLERKLREIKGNSLQFNMGNFNLKKTNSNERTMSLNEKAIIKNNIKLLTIEQKKGIANILRDTIDTENKKVLEFDIDKLNNKKLKQLDEYVKNCLRDNNLNQEKMASDYQKLKNDLTDNNLKVNSTEYNNRDNFDIEKDIENSCSISDDSDSSELL
jgi:hypothetical protein